MKPLGGMGKAILTPKNRVPAGPYSLGVQLGNFVFLSGQIATSDYGSVMDGFDVRAQTELVIDKMVAILSDAEMSLDDVVSTTVYLQSLSDYEAMNEIYSTRFSNPYPARATVLADLAGEGFVG